LSLPLLNRFSISFASFFHLAGRGDGNAASSQRGAVGRSSPHGLVLLGMLANFMADSSCSRTTGSRNTGRGCIAAGRPDDQSR
jgi:hypothetical protein